MLFFSYARHWSAVSSTEYWSVFTIGIAWTRTRKRQHRRRTCWWVQWSGAAAAAAARWRKGVAGRLGRAVEKVASLGRGEAESARELAGSVVVPRSAPSADRPVARAADVVAGAGRAREENAVGDTDARVADEEADEESPSARCAELATTSTC